MTSAPVNIRKHADVASYIRPEWMTDALVQTAESHADGEDYAQAWHAHKLAESLDTLRANLDASRASAPLYRDDPAAWQATLERIIGETFPLDTGDYGRLYVWQCDVPRGVCDGTAPEGYVTDATRAYLVCALWSSVGEDEEPLDHDHDVDDIAPESVDSAREDVAAMIETSRVIIARHKIMADSFGHDFWLTRNHHGAGFWDRGYGADGDTLTQAAHAYGSADLYIGDDGKAYLS